jgi:hypothetical protein
VELKVVILSWLYLKEPRKSHRYSGGNARGYRYKIHSLPSVANPKLFFLLLYASCRTCEDVKVLDIQAVLAYMAAEWGHDRWQAGIWLVHGKIFRCRLISRKISNNHEDHCKYLSQRSKHITTIYFKQGLGVTMWKERSISTLLL